jgi:hypothetical protein
VETQGPAHSGGALVTGTYRSHREDRSLGSAIEAGPGPAVPGGGAFMIAWILGFCAGPIVLAGFAGYLCRGPRRLWRLTREQIAEVQVLADLERHENML